MIVLWCYLMKKEQSKNDKEYIIWYWNHIQELSGTHRKECTCHYCIQLIEKGYFKKDGRWYK
jgi:hypothetical protein